MGNGNGDDKDKPLGFWLDFPQGTHFYDLWLHLAKADGEGAVLSVIVLYRPNGPGERPYHLLHTITGGGVIQGTCPGDSSLAECREVLPLIEQAALFDAGYQLVKCAHQLVDGDYAALLAALRDIPGVQTFQAPAMPAGQRPAS